MLRLSLMKQYVAIIIQCASLRAKCSQFTSNVNTLINTKTATKKRNSLSVQKSQKKPRQSGGKFSWRGLCCDAAHHKTEKNKNQQPAFHLHHHWHSSTILTYHCSPLTDFSRLTNNLFFLAFSSQQTTAAAFCIFSSNHPNFHSQFSTAKPNLPCTISMFRASLHWILGNQHGVHPDTGFPDAKTYARFSSFSRPFAMKIFSFLPDGTTAHYFFTVSRNALPDRTQLNRTAPHEIHSQTEHTNGKQHTQMMREDRRPIRGVRFDSHPVSFDGRADARLRWYGTKCYFFLHWK